MKFKNLIEQCVAESIVETSRQNSSTLKKLVKESVMDVLKESLIEGFDPQSMAGPNPNVNEPGFYDRMNATMQKMEEGEVKRVCMHCKKVFETTHIDGPTPKHNESHGICRDCWDILHKADHGEFPEEPTKEELSSEPHGREAQFASAGQFDPSNFSKLE